MPFGSWKNNLSVMIALGFIGVSLISTVAGQVMWNTRTIKTTIQQQAVIMKQNEELLVQHREMLIILHSIERRYLDGRTR